VIIASVQWRSNNWKPCSCVAVLLICAKLLQFWNVLHIRAEFCQPHRNPSAMSVAQSPYTTISSLLVDAHCQAHCCDLLFAFTGFRVNSKFCNRWKLDDVRVPKSAKCVRDPKARVHTSLIAGGVRRLQLSRCQNTVQRTSKSDTGQDEHLQIRN
jgi:hypothetical protein